MKKDSFPCHDVRWFIPDKKKPFYYTTLWCKNFLHYVAHEFLKTNGKSPKLGDLLNAVSCDLETQNLLNEMIKRLGEQTNYLDLYGGD